jgi:beta-ribofuranosylaminobenzene 5'-phosphate synthase
VTTVVAHPRLHFGLLDLGSATQRIFGGVGAALEQPTTQVSVKRSVSSAIISDVEIGDDLVRDLSLALERLEDFIGGTSPVRVRLDSLPPTHIGLGSKTTAMLAVLAAANIEAVLKVVAGRVSDCHYLDW